MRILLSSSYSATHVHTVLCICYVGCHSETTAKIQSKLVLSISHLEIKLGMGQCFSLFLRGGPLTSWGRGVVGLSDSDKKCLALIIYCNHFSHVTSAENKTDTFRESLMQNFTQEKNYHASTYPEKKNSLWKCAKKSHVYRLYQSSDRPLPPNKLSNGRLPRPFWPRILLGFVAVLIDFCNLF